MTHVKRRFGPPGREGVTSLVSLTTLDVSENQLESLEGLRGHPNVSTLLAYGNKIKNVEGLDALRECPALTTLDLSKNKLSDRSCVDFLTEHLGDQLSLLKLQGNPVVSEVPSYRKTIVCGFKGLNYLDDMPAGEEGGLEKWSIVYFVHLFDAFIHARILSSELRGGVTEGYARTRCM